MKNAYVVDMMNIEDDTNASQQVLEEVEKYHEIIFPLVHSGNAITGSQFEDILGTGLIEIARPIKNDRGKLTGEVEIELINGEKVVVEYEPLMEGM